MRLQVRVVEDARDAAVAHGDVLGAQVITEKVRRPMGDRNADLVRRPTRLGDYSRGVDFRERERGRPDRGASASFDAGSSVSRKRSRHSNTVRMWTPTSMAVSFALTPSAISKSACARRAMRSSVFPARIAASTTARCAGVSKSGFAGGPGRARATHGPESIMPFRYTTRRTLAKLQADGTRRAGD